MPAVRMKVTVTFEYEATPGHYDSDDPVEMAAVDEENLNNDPMALLTFMETEDTTIEVRPV